MKKLVLALLTMALLIACPKAHYVNLSWHQSEPPEGGAITGNNIYRSSQPGGPYHKIYGSSTPITNYTDTNVRAGKTYYYVVTSIAGQRESKFSSEISARVPEP